FGLVLAGIGQNGLFGEYGHRLTECAKHREEGGTRRPPVAIEESVNHALSVMLGNEVIDGRLVRKVAWLAEGKGEVVKTLNKPAVPGPAFDIAFEHIGN